MDEIKHVYSNGDSCGWGAGGIAAAAVAFLAVGGLALWAGNRKCDEGAKYMAAKSQGLQEAGIACNSAGIARVENTLSQLQQNQLLGAMTAAGVQSVINSQNVNQQKTDTGLAVIANQIGQTNAVLNKALGNCFVWSKDICPSTTTTTTSSAA